MKGKNNRYFLKPLNEVPCIALIEVTFQFINKANEVDVPVWDIVKKVIKSDEYKQLKENFNQSTVEDYLKLLQEKVEEEKGVKVPVVIKKKPLLPFYCWKARSMSLLFLEK